MPRRNNRVNNETLERTARMGLLRFRPDAHTLAKLMKFQPWRRGVNLEGKRLRASREIFR